MLPGSEYDDAGQGLQLVMAVAPVDIEYVPREHSKHAADPFMGLYWPASHAEHSVPSLSLIHI